MAIEAIKGAGMAYQGGSAAASAYADAGKVQSVDVATASEAIAKETSAMNVKETNSDGGGNGAGGNAYSNAETQQSQQSQIKKAVEEINRKAKDSEAVFGVHEGTNRVTIKIVDRKSKEVIKEFPPDKTLDMIARVWEMAGLMVDEKR